VALGQTPLDLLIFDERLMINIDQRGKYFERKEEEEETLIFGLD